MDKPSAADRLRSSVNAATSRARENLESGDKKRKAANPKASAWDKISSRDSSETIAYRDVYNSQQIERGQRTQLLSVRNGYIGAVVAGLLTFGLLWVLYSFIAVGLSMAGASLGVGGAGDSNSSAQAPRYYEETQRSGKGGVVETCFVTVKENGLADPKSKCYAKSSDVPVPAWAKDQVEAAKQAGGQKGVAEGEKSAAGPLTVGQSMTQVTGTKLLITLGAGLAATLAIGGLVKRRVLAANIMHSTDDINQHSGDPHIALPEEIQQKYDWFPDAGAHSSVQVNSILSHMMLSAKGAPKVDVTVRADRDIRDPESGDVEYYKGEALEDDEGELITTSLPIIDDEFGDRIFNATGVISPSARVKYEIEKIPYNPGGKDRLKQGAGGNDFATVADLVKNDWILPEYEVQRPAGAYIVDTAPVNTMVLAMTRAGKGQTYIEPIIDSWSRERNPGNIVANDPKGELLRKTYVPLTIRGFQPVQFNLMNPEKTDIYNPLGMAAEAAREGDSFKCSLYVENIAEVFFPLDGGEDPVWANSANNAFKRAAFGLIDFYLEEERELREIAVRTNMDPGVLMQRLDDMWGKVTLYNCYQLFVLLTSKKLKNPKAEIDAQVAAGTLEKGTEEYEDALAEIEDRLKLWEDKPEQDMLSLFFNASEQLPMNSMRTLVGNANNALRSMAGSEKMLASVYGIAITAMSFFADPTISTLTSGKPSQATDMAGLSFPRRLGVRFAANYLTRDNLIGLQVRWRAFADPEFTQDLGKDFEHEDTISRNGWARYYFKGIFPEKNAWIQMDMVNSRTGLLVRTFYFHFTKSEQLSFTGRHFVKNPITGEKIIKDGVLREMKRIAGGPGEKDRFEYGNTEFPHVRLNLDTDGSTPEKLQGTTRAITQTMTRYCEQPKAVFLVTPPHLTKYAKLLLILLKQLVDFNFDQSYLTKADQKPLYRTRFMLDELGNLQSEGQGIASFETMLSIGLGQDQQFTLILQTLQQLMAVYGDDTDKIVQGNVSNIIFLKSTDDDMIKTLSGMSGVTHQTYRDSKQVSQDVDKLIGNKNDARVSYTISTVEEPLIKENDLMFLSGWNSIVFRAGDMPIWNRNQTIMPVQFELLKNTIIHPGHEYTLQTLPTLSSNEFDVRMNQPDFKKMLEKRIMQATFAERAKEIYQKSYDYSDVEIERLDPDLYADEVMEIVMSQIHASLRSQGVEPSDEDEVLIDSAATLGYGFDDDDIVDNDELQEAVAEHEMGRQDRERKRYANKTLAREDLVSTSGEPRVGNYVKEISTAYRLSQQAFAQDHAHFSVGPDGDLRDPSGAVTYISAARSTQFTEAAQTLSDASRDPSLRTYAEDGVNAQEAEDLVTSEVHPAFYTFLAKQESWNVFASGEFERQMGILLRD